MEPTAGERPIPSTIRGSILGTRVTRTEDPELVRGIGRYVADLGPDDGLIDPLHVAFVRSEYAHGTITAIDTADALAHDGVVAVWTAADLGVAPHQGLIPIHDDFARPPLADGVVRFVGEPIAAVFATSQALAVDAAATVIVDIDPLPAVVDPEQALALDAPLLFPQRRSNVALSVVDDPEIDLEAISDVVVRGRYVNQRMAVAAMEPTCCAAARTEDGRLRIWASTQMPHGLWHQAAHVLGLSEAQIHVRTPRVGGGFGGKAGLYPEYTVVAAAAHRLGRGVVWIPPRSEDMLSLLHGRAQIHYAELGCRADGTFTGLRGHLVGDAGAYPGTAAALAGMTRRMAPGTYHIPQFQFDAVAAATNTLPVGAYRGAGRPEATALIERLVDQAARQLEIDPIEIRVRNFIRPDEFPFKTITGLPYDTGDYERPLRRAAELAGYDELRVEQARRRQAGDTLQLGIGVSAYVEITAGGGSQEYGRVEVHPDGSATMFAGTSAHGQGHQTAYATLVSDLTGLPIERIRLVDGDTDLVPSGGGTGGSRSLQLGGSAVRGATEALVDRAREIAARHLEADPADIVLDTTTASFSVAGVPAVSVSWAELATMADEGLDGEHTFSQGGPTFPFGAHISVVEVDVETGQARLRRHIAVDDCGRVLNPLLVEGQQHGGVAAAIGQALFEEIAFDEDGNPLTVNFADYTVASAAELPSFEAATTETPTPLNPLGAKGIGEASTIGATPAVQNAVIDAVAHLGVQHIDMPCTAQRVWQAIQHAQRGEADPWREPPDVFARLRASAGSSGGTDSAAIDDAAGI